ncbi:PDDEXK family nuclease [Rufibacter roseolus]|uniref:hypothetical protein n=1 Tax=Rufibacter roseolus TaxID=2817375 RepID=UPI001B30DB3C|nr:hypothetical protein [Rufibacter roseolus]
MPNPTTTHESLIKTFTVSKKEIATGKVSFEDIRTNVSQMGIDTIEKFRLAKKEAVLKTPSMDCLKELCFLKTGLPFNTFFNFKKNSFKEKLYCETFIAELAQWCKDNNINSLSEYNDFLNKPDHFPSYERIRQIYGTGYFRDKLDVVGRVYKYLTKEEAREVCMTNGVLRSQHYLSFSQKYNEEHEVRLPSDFSRFYNTTWNNFIQLSATQMFMGNSMSNLELVTYKLLYDRDIEFETEKSFTECRSKKPLPFDFYLPNHNGEQVLIELDGEQHRVDSPESLYYSRLTKKHDNIKDIYCIEKGIKLIRISNLIDIEPALKKELKLDQYPRKRELDWTQDLKSEDTILSSSLSKSLKVKLLLLLGDKGKSKLTNVEIIKLTGIHQPAFSKINKDMITAGMISRPNVYHYTEKELANIVELYRIGKTITEIVNLTGYKNRTYLVKRIKEAGVNYISKRPSK